MADILGTFSKGVDGSYSLNFHYAGGNNCDTSCRHHPDSAAENPTHACYAAKVEQRGDRIPLLNKLKRHAKQGATFVCNAALLELQKIHLAGQQVAWLRLSTGGSLPQPADVTDSLRQALRALLTYCRQTGIDVHIPVETNEKAEFYRSIIGDLACIRESLQESGSHTTAENAVSWVAGDDITTGRNIRQRRIAAAMQQAAERRQATGRKTIVCPAVVAGFRLKTSQAILQGAKRRNNAADIEAAAAEVDRRRQADKRSKCGSCKACSLSGCDIVYPLH